HVELQPAFGEHRDHEPPQAPLHVVPFRHCARPVPRDIEHESQVQRAAGSPPARRRAHGTLTAGPGISSARVSHFSTLPGHSVMAIPRTHRPRSPYQGTKSGKLNSVPSSLYALPASSVRAQVRRPAMTRAGHEAWPDGSFVQQLPDADRAALLDAGTPLRFEDDEILLVQGDTGDFVYVLTSGLVKVIVAAESGAQTM